MEMARVQRLTEIQVERNKLLDESDKEILRQTDFQETGRENKMAETLNYRQMLRDIPQNINLAIITTPEELEAFEPVWPEFI